MKLNIKFCSLALNEETAALESGWTLNYILTFKENFEVISVHSNKACGGVEECLQVFLTSALDGDELSSLFRGGFTPGEENRFDTH
jgi:hypothetical protein